MNFTVQTLIKEGCREYNAQYTQFEECLVSLFPFTELSVTLYPLTVLCYFVPLAVLT